MGILKILVLSIFWIPLPWISINPRFMRRWISCSIMTRIKIFLSMDLVDFLLVTLVTVDKFSTVSLSPEILLNLKYKEWTVLWVYIIMLSLECSYLVQRFLVRSLTMRFLLQQPTLTNLYIQFWLFWRMEKSMIWMPLLIK